MDIARYLDDASGYRGEADRVFAPGDVSEVRDIVRQASAQRIPLTVSGAGTGLTGARVPHGGWVLSLEHFRDIEVEPGRVQIGRAHV